MGKRGPKPEMLWDVTPEQIAWAAGIYEGEGTCYISTSSAGRKDIYLTVVQKDREILDRLSRLFGNKVLRVSPPSWNGNAQHLWRITGMRARKFINLVLQHLSARRQDQILQVFKKVV